MINQHQEDRLLRLPQVTNSTGLKRASIYEQMAANTFPKQVKIGARSVAWRKSEIDAWILSRQHAA